MTEIKETGTKKQILPERQRAAREAWKKSGGVLKPEEIQWMVERGHFPIFGGENGRWGPEGPQTPEGPVVPTRQANEKPAVCLGDLGNYRQRVELPAETIEVKEEEQTITVWDPRKMDTDQLIRATLELLHDGILNEHTFHGVEKSVIEKQYLRVLKQKIGETDPRCTALSNLTQSVFNFQDILYTVWNRKNGASGSKHNGALEMIGAVKGLDDRTFMDFIQDPHITAAMMRVRGSVSDKDFTNGKTERRNRQGKGDPIGDIYGGELGAVEKVAYYLRSWSGLLSFDGFDDPPALQTASYTLYIPSCPREYFNKGDQYQAYKYVLDDNERRYVSPDRRKAVLHTFDPLAPLSVFHDRASVDFIWDNFTEEHLGGQNIGRMLSLLEGGANRDPRWRAYQEKTRRLGARTAQEVPARFLEFINANQADRRRMTAAAFDVFKGSTSTLSDAMLWRQFEAEILGAYTLEEFLFADESGQKEMGKAAVGLYKKQKEKVQKRIVKINMQQTYYWSELTDGDVVADRTLDTKGWRRRALLNFNETDGKGNLFVDIGAFDFRYWNNQASGCALNAYWTDIEYAYRTIVKVYDPFMQTDPEHLQERIKTFKELLKAEVGFRHLSETMPDKVETAPKSSEMPVELNWERQRLTLHFAEILSENSMLGIWEHRSKGRERLTWSMLVNNHLREFLDAHRYRREFETAGIYNRDWLNLIDPNNRLTEGEKMAKILSKMERPEVWTVFLRSIGLTENIRETMGGRVPDRWTPPPGWAEVGVTDYWDYLSYNAMVAFSGFRVQGNPFVDRDPYGNPVPRVRFDFDFENPDDRGNGRYWMELLGSSVSEGQKQRHWQAINKTLTGIYRGGKLVDYGELNEGTFSMFNYFFEKMHEESIIDNLLENYLQETFDKDRNNWWTNHWGKNLMLKKRWDRWSLLRRQMKYTVGELSEEEHYVGERLERGWFVHDQVKTTPDGKIIVSERGLPTFNAFIDGFDRVASMTLGSSGVFRPPERLMTPPVHDINSRNAQERREAEIEREQRKHTLTTDAGLVEQISWVPIYYNKFMLIVNFHYMRLNDPYYRIETALNAHEQWEMDVCYAEVLDPGQREEYWNAMDSRKNGPEDHAWVEAQKERLGIDAARIVEFKEIKGEHLHYELDTGKPLENQTQEDLASGQAAIINAGLPKGLSFLQKTLTGRTLTEVKHYWAASGVSYVGLNLAVTAASAAGIISFPGFVVVPGTALVALMIGSRFKNKSIDNSTGREQSYSSLSALRLKIPGLGTIPFGIVALRISDREPAKMIQENTTPVWDSALNIKGPLEDIVTNRKYLVPQGFSDKG